MFATLTKEEREKIMLQHDLEDLQKVFETRLNGRCVSVGYKNGNVRIPIVFDNIELISYQNGECHLCEEDFPDAPHAIEFSRNEIKEIEFDDFSIMPDHTGGQILISFRNGDCMDIVADF